MYLAYTQRKSSNVFRYYGCRTALKQGVHVCPNHSVNAAEIERFVLGKLAGVGENDRLQACLARLLPQFDAEEIADTVFDFEAVFRELSPDEQNRLLTLILRQVLYSSSHGTISLSFHVKL